MKTLAKSAINALLAVGLAGTAIAPVYAHPHQYRTLSVSTAGIDLGSPEGQKILDQRIEKAVRHVCRTTNPDTGTRMISNEAQQCLARARSEAKQQLAALIAKEQRGG
ncbi:UrcA family protein [Erythrobacter sp. NE805]|uniref:UrcA family protein n=1 Tax=Erythrobacter sp. NE805 TaxID=3389875 RepID=UPI00396AFADB